MRKKTRTKVLRLIILMVVLAICGGVVALALRGALPIEELNRHQSLISFVATVFGLISAFLVFTKDVFPKKSSKKAEATKQTVFFSDPSTFINRLDELRRLLGALETNKVICVHGQKGVGKSEFLKFASDLLLHPKRVGKKFDSSVTLTTKQREAIYVDLFDSASMEDVTRQIAFATGGVEAGTTQELLEVIRNAHGNESIVLILDNLNNVASVQGVVNFALRYREARPSDIFIFGSINHISDPRQSIASIELLPFNSVHCGEFLASREVSVTDQELQAVMHRTGGLPLFIGLIANYRDIEKSETADFSAYFVEEIYLRLKKDERELLVFLCICNLSRTTLSPENLMAAEFPYVDARLAALRRFSAIIWTTSERGNLIKAHDLIRDIVLRHENKLVSSLAQRVADYFIIEGDRSGAVLPALLATEAGQDKNWLEVEISLAIDRKDYPVITNWWENLTEKASPQSVFAESPELRERLLLAYLRALLGIGAYHKARSLTESSLFRKIISSRPGAIKTQRAYQLQLALSDLDHLLNNYTLARSSIEFIMAECKRLGWLAELALTRWHWAHLTGHIGDDLKAALSQYSSCQSEALELDEKMLAARAFNGSVALQFTMDGGETLKEGDIKDRINRIAEVPGNGPTLSALYRNLSRLHRLRGNGRFASDAIEQSAKIARLTGLRTLINCDYARAENARFEGRFRDAVSYYSRVIEAAAENGDDNLRSSAMLGTVICDLCSKDGLIFHECFEILETTLDEAEHISDKYDMLITKARIRVIRASLISEHSHSERLLAQALSNLSELGLERDIGLLELGKDAIQQLEIHVH